MVRKKERIVHYVIKNKDFNVYVYLCNQATAPVDVGKMTYDWSEVTCKNCMKRLPTKGAEEILKKVGLL